jgi:DNA-binding MarR family transcriptional regulator
MSNNGLTHDDLLRNLVEAGRNHSTSTILFHHVLAERLGLNPTDHKCLDVIIQRGPMTAGQLSELSGLTTGTITAVIDRLVKARFVKRVAAPEDRRKVMLHPTWERFDELENLFRDFLEAQSQLLGRYNDDELRVILDYVTAITQMVDEQAVNLKKNASRASSKDG